MAEVIDTTHERDLLATDEMIRNMRAGRFRNIAIGVGAAGAALLLGGSALLWASKQGTDPEALKEALKNLPPLQITVKLDPESKIGIEPGGKVQIEEGGTVALEPGARVTVRGSVTPTPAPKLPPTGPEDPAIQTTVVVFKSVEYAHGRIVTGWKYANGAAKTPFEQYCHFASHRGSGNGVIEEIGQDGKIGPTPPGVEDQSRRFAQCQWFNGGA